MSLWKSLKASFSGGSYFENLNELMAEENAADVRFSQDCAVAEDVEQQIREHAEQYPDWAEASKFSDRQLLELRAEKAAARGWDELAAEYLTQSEVENPDHYFKMARASPEYFREKLEVGKIEEAEDRQLEIQEEEEFLGEDSDESLFWRDLARRAPSA